MQILKSAQCKSMSRVASGAEGPHESRVAYCHVDNGVSLAQISVSSMLGGCNWNRLKRSLICVILYAAVSPS